MQALSCDLWLMEKNAMRQFVSMVRSGLRPEPEQVREGSAPKREKSIAIVPIHGVLEDRPSWLGQYFGMSSYEAIGYTMDSLVMDDSVKGIILDINSPGGMASGAIELAEKIYSYRGAKPIISVAHHLAASGGYWIGAAASRFVGTPSSNTGSVGVLWEHLSFAEANERDGVKATVIRSTDAPFKAEGTDLEHLSDEARQNMQARADEIHSRFVSDLARFRGVSVDYVNQGFGKGRVVDSKKALAAGMIDRIDTLQSIVGKMGAGRIRIAGAKAEDNWDSPTDREIKMQRAAALKAIAEQPPTERAENV